MGNHAFNPQSASDEVARQGAKLDNLVPTLVEWQRLRDKAHEEAERTGKPLGGFTTEGHVSVARGIHDHAAELRRALSALEAFADELLKVNEERREALLDGFLK